MVMGEQLFYPEKHCNTVGNRVTKVAVQSLILWELSSLVPLTFPQVSGKLANLNKTPFRAVFNPNPQL